MGATPNSKIIKARQAGQRIEQRDRAKITVVVGGSFGAQKHAYGKAYDPRFIFAWPTVMGAAQAPAVIFDISRKAAEAGPPRLR